MNKVQKVLVASFTAFILITGIFANVSTVSAQSVTGCENGAVYNSITGATCPALVVPGCAVGASFNIITGASCMATASIAVISPNGGEWFSNMDIIPITYNGINLSNEVTAYLTSATLGTVAQVTASTSAENYTNGRGSIPLDLLSNKTQTVIGGNYKINLCDNKQSGQPLCDMSNDYIHITDSINTQPYATINNSPSLKLNYDSAKKESSLTASFNVTVTGGAIDTKINSIPFYVNLLDTTKNYTGQGITTVTSQVTQTVGSDGVSYYNIPANGKVTFVVNFTAAPSQLFAGKYFARLYGYNLESTSNSLEVRPSTNSTNAVTIVGETSPYITKVTATPITKGLSVKIEGVRLFNSTPTLNYATDISGITKTTDGKNITFLAKLDAGQYSVQVADPKTGTSNTVWFNVSDTTSTSTPSITVNYPNGGEYVGNSFNYNINWSTTGAIANVKIDLYKAGKFLKNIVAKTANNGNYTWAVTTSLIDSADYSIRISDTANLKTYDESNANFTISATSQYVYASFPVGGESLLAGTAQTITWTKYGTLPMVWVKIDLYKGGNFVKNIISYTSAATGKYIWNIPLNTTPGDDYKIRISNYSNAGVYSMTWNNFKIVSPYNANITFSAATTTLTQGASTKLSWTTVDAVTCYLKDLTAKTATTTVAINGTANTAILFKDNSYQLSCKNKNNVVSASPVLTITVSAVPIIKTFSAATSSVAFNQATKLNWTTNSANVTSCALNGVNVVLNSAVAGYPTGNLPATKLFTLICKNKIGETNTATTSVTVIQPNAVVANISTVGTSTVGYGESAILTWSSINAKTCSVKGGTINSALLANTVSTGPLSTTTKYAMSCSNIAGVVATSSVTVVVNPKGAPDTTFAANGISSSTVNIDYGSNVVLNWTGSGSATYCTLNGVRTTTLVGTKTLLAQKVNSIQNFTCYNVTNVKTEKIINIVVGAQNPVTISLSANGIVSNNPSQTIITIPYKNTAKLAWTTNNAKTCKMNGVAVAINSTSYITPALATTTNYRLACLNEQGIEASSNALVQVTQPDAAVIKTFSVASSTLGYNLATKLNWTTSNAVSCTLNGVNTVLNSAVTGVTTGNLTATKTYTLACKNNAGAVTTNDQTVTVIQPEPAVPTISANSTSINYGESTFITWSSTKAKTCTVKGGVINAITLSGSQSTGVLNANTTYTMACKNTAGVENTASITVNVIPKALPTITTFSATNSTGAIANGGETLTVIKGSKATLRWAVSGTVKTCTLNGVAKVPVSSLILSNIITNSTQTLKCNNGVVGGDSQQAINIQLAI